MQYRFHYQFCLLASVSCSRRRLTKWRIDRDYKRGLPKRLAIRNRL